MSTTYVSSPCVTTTAATSTAGYTVGGIGSSCYPNVGNITINGSGSSGQYFTSSGTWANPIYTTTIGTSTTSPSIRVTGDADFDGNVKIKGHDIVKLLEKMESRLAILMDPDPEKLEKFQALKKAYDNYKLLEKLCVEEKKED